MKDEGISVKSFSPIVFRMSIKGATEMDYRIETKESFRIIGVSAPLQKEIENNFMVVPKMWEDAVKNQTIQKLATMMDSSPKGLFRRECLQRRGTMEIFYCGFQHKSER